MPFDMRLRKYSCDIVSNPLAFKMFHIFVCAMPPLSSPLPPPASSIATIESLSCCISVFVLNEKIARHSFKRETSRDCVCILFCVLEMFCRFVCLAILVIHSSYLYILLFCRDVQILFSFQSQGLFLSFLSFSSHLIASCWD